MCLPTQMQSERDEDNKSKTQTSMKWNTRIGSCQKEKY
jgi:hypothetical protein